MTIPKHELIEALNWSGFRVHALERIEDPKNDKKRVWHFHVEATKPEMLLIPDCINPNWISFKDMRMKGNMTDTQASYLIGWHAIGGNVEIPHNIYEKKNA